MKKQHFPIFKNNQHPSGKPLIYLDSAATSQKPQVVLDAMMHAATHINAAANRGAYSLSVQASQLIDMVREKVARFFGPTVKATNVIFTKSATESLNLVAYGMAHSSILKSGGDIVSTVAEHHANLLPWQHAAKILNSPLKHIPLNFETLQLEPFSLNANTALISMAQVGNVLGQINPIASMAALAKQVSAYCVVDGAQGAASMPLQDPFAMGVHAYAFSAHKMYGPSGLGVLLLCDELLEKLPPFLLGGGMVSAVELQHASFLSGFEKFEPGVPPLMEIAGLGAALDFLTDITPAAVHQHCALLNTLFQKKLQQIDGISIFSPSTGHETLTAFSIDHVHAHDAATIFDAQFNVAMRAGHHCAWPLLKQLKQMALIRASFGIYNTEEDVNTAIEAIQYTKKLMGN